MAGKIVRIYFNYAGQQFCVDRPLNADLNEQENCDQALNALIEGMSKTSVVPALMLVRNEEQDENGIKTVEKGVPVIVNLSRMDYLSIVNVGIYNPPEAGPAHE